jgi:hypothetical protein
MKVQTTTTDALAQAIAKFPQATAVRFVDQAHTMTAEQIVHTAAAYSYVFDGDDVIDECRKYYNRHGHGTTQQFYARIMELRSSSK